LEIGERIKKLREALKISQADLAKSIGVSSGNVGDWERGRAKPGFDALLALSRFFNKSVDWLMTGKEPTYSDNVFPEEIILSRQDIEMLPLSHTERFFLKKLRKLTEKERSELKKIIENKGSAKLTPEQLKVINDILQKL